MTSSIAQMGPLSGWTPRGLPLEQRGTDRQWLHVGIIVFVLTGIGVSFSQAFSSQLPDYTFTYRASIAIVPLAILAILIFGFHRFPTAAGIFFGYLPIAQASHPQNWVLGDVDAALTFEMVLAIPLLIVGLVGPHGAPAANTRPLPTGLKVLFGLWILVALAATATARDVGISAATLLSRFLLPMAVMFVTYRRLRSIADYRALWFGLVVGLVLIGVYQYRRGVIGDTPFYLNLDQRFLGASQSYSLPMLYAVGGALWLGLARAQKGRTWSGILWFLLVGGFVVLLWIGATRGPLLMFGVLALWWLPTFLRGMHRPGIMLLTLFGGLAVFGFARYSLGHTTQDVGLMMDRLQDLWTGGLAGHNRAEVWGMATDYWRESPLLGIGPNSWVTFNTGYESPHSLVFGLLCDVGAVGLLAFIALSIAVLVYSRRAARGLVDPDDRFFFSGCRAGWVVMLFTHVTNLPFSSGQPANNIHAYMVYLFPLLVMTVWSRHVPLPAHTASPLPMPVQAYGSVPLPAAAPGRGPAPLTP